MISQLYLYLLQIIANEKNPKVRKLILLSFTKDKKFIKALRSLCKNTAKGKLRLSEKDKNKISSHLKDIKYFAVKRNATKTRIVQKGGGFLSVLVPIAAAILGPLINGALKKDDDGSV